MFSVQQSICTIETIENSNDCSKQMAMTVADRNQLLLENMKKSAAKKGGKPLKGSPLKGKKQPKP